eukprot:CAMPEP_0171206062 /NCGR_PEP_ID=MMETSP0790-20130122/26869_1 /TAXON_ID=2925 /ORGANISM="Alexandrium catenella, Strain OF101" /LENGTH=296 /DNA_ID=CAMNT_0011671595 /DNA_START=66 /DNA_END=956 /DNA_ORIENTATION=-
MVEPPPRFSIESVGPFRTIELSRSGKVAVLTLNRPEVLNALNWEIVGEMLQAVAAVRDDETVRALLVTGKGRGFCAGADLAAKPRPKGSPIPGGRPSTMGAGSAGGMRAEWNPLMAGITRLQKPVVSAVNGVAAGGGVGVALAADVVLAARSARFVLTFVPKLGVVPDLGVTWMLPRLIGRGKAMPMIALGDACSSEEAERIGLIWRVVDDDALHAEALKTAERLASVPQTLALVRARDLIDAAPGRTYEAQLEAEADGQHVMFDQPGASFKKGSSRFQQASKRREASAKPASSKL